MVALNDLDEFTRAYIEAALWSSNDESDDRGGEPLDANYGPEDIAPESLEKVFEDCRKFQEEWGHLLTDENCHYHGCSCLTYAGHDFWFTRNGHGCGFWDGDWEDSVGETLTAACKEFRELYPCVGDDGKIYFE